MARKGGGGGSGPEKVLFSKRAPSKRKDLCLSVKEGGGGRFSVLEDSVFIQVPK